MRTLKLKTYVPYALAVGLALVGVAVAQRGSTHNLSTGLDTQAQIGTSANAEEPKVTINGTEVDLGADGEAVFSTDGTTVQVSGNSTRVNSEGGRTVITNEDGTVDVNVSSSSNSDSSETTVRLDGGSDIEWENNSSIEVQVRGESD